MKRFTKNHELIINNARARIALMNIVEDEAGTYGALITWIMDYRPAAFKFRSRYILYLSLSMFVINAMNTISEILTKLKK